MTNNDNKKYDKELYDFLHIPYEGDVYIDNSDISSFQVTLYNLNYGVSATAAKITIEGENVAITHDHVAIEVAIGKLNASKATIDKAKAVFANMGTDGIFGRSDVAAINNDSATAAGNLITKLKIAELIESVGGFGEGKYKFIQK